MKSKYVLTPLQEYLLKNAIRLMDTEAIQNIFDHMSDGAGDYKDRFRRNPTIDNARSLFEELRAREKRSGNP